MTVTPPVPSRWRRLAARALTVARNPVVKPFEVWAIRAAVAYLAVKLGITIDHSA